MSDISQWAVAAGDNNASPPDGAPEGMARSAVNDVMREMMAATARFYAQIKGSLVSAGTSNAYTLTSGRSHAALGDVGLLVFRADRVNTGAVTLDVDGLGAKALRRPTGATLGAGDLYEDRLVAALYNPEQDQYEGLNLGEFPAGTSLLFPQASAPSGWVQDTEVNDRVIRITSGAGGGTGGSWTISGLSVNNTSLAVSNLAPHGHGDGSLAAASHDHPIPFSNTVDGLQGGGAQNARLSGSGASTSNSGSLGVSGTTDAVGSGSAHGHGLSADGNWRPAYLNCIRAVKS